MKQFPFLVALLFLSSFFQGFTQTDGVIIDYDGQTREPSAILEVFSTTQGFLAPRLTLAQRNAITNPATSLLIFQTDNNPGYYYNLGTPATPQWERFLDPSITIAGNTLNSAYDQGGAGQGREINATDGAVRINGDDGFLVTGTFGSGDAIEVSGAGTRMFFNPRKAAFRAGYVSGIHWDYYNIGDYSTAIGYNTFAHGSGSTAIGYQSSALREGAVALGTLCSAGGNSATALGYQTRAELEHSTSMGYRTTALAPMSTAMGDGTRAEASNSTAMGYETTASGFASTAMGHLTKAEGRESTAMGVYTTASGGVSTAMGQTTTASGDYSTAMGLVTRAEGYGSTAMGEFTTASGNISTAMGSSTTASGDYSTAMGDDTRASGNISTAMGRSTTASGYASTAMGAGTRAEGDFSTAMGSVTTARSACETVIGQLNTDYSPLSTAGWMSADRLFVIGNGTGSNLNGGSVRSDAMVVLKNGNTGFGTSTPTSNVHIKNTGDASIWIEADSDNAFESDNAYLKISQDGNDVNSIIGLSGGDNLSPTGVAYTGVTNNALLIGTETANADIQLGTNNAVRMTIAKTTGRVGIRTTAPSSDLHLKMSASDFPNPTTGGITLEQSNSADEWQIWNSNPFLSFARNNVRVAYVNNISGAWTVTSDRRVKKDIEPLEDVLSKVMQLNTVKYRYNHNEDDAIKTRGFIAQEVQEVFPDLVYTEDGNQLGIAPSDFGILSIKAIQEQQAQIEAHQLENEQQQAQIEAQQLENKQQQALIEQLLQRIEQLENK